MFYCGKIIFIWFNHVDIIGVKQCSTSAASLDDRYCEATIPIGECDLTMGAAHETALASSTIFVFQVENFNIHGVDLKMSSYNRD